MTQLKILLKQSKKCSKFMPDIHSEIKYSLEIETAINSKKAQIGFNHTNWSDEDLEKVRVSIRTFYTKEQVGVCAYSKQNVSTTSALNCHVEHIVPKSKYLDFIFTPKNLCVICADCNTIKREQETLGTIPNTITGASTRQQYPRTPNAFKIVHPHFDIYEDNILITNGYYIDKTPKGHFTIGACKLNRKLHEFGWEVTDINDATVTETMNKYLDEKDPIKRNSYLTKLKKQLILT